MTEPMSDERRAELARLVVGAIELLPERTLDYTTKDGAIDLLADGLDELLTATQTGRREREATLVDGRLQYLQGREHDNG